MMRNGQNKRMRGRNRNNNNNNNHNRGHHHNPLTRVYESNGPDVKIRGTAHHIAEKYLQLARDATSVGDHVTAEAHHQHAEHYFRLIAAAQEQFRQQNPHYQPQPAPVDDNRDGAPEDGDAGQPGQSPQNFGAQQQNFQPREQPQPYGGNQPYGGAQPQQPQQQQMRPPHQQQPYQQQQPQPQQQAQPNFGGSEVGGLPSFITGGQPQQAPQYGSNGHDGQGGQGERFPMHRRRRRHRGPHSPQQDTRGDAPEAPGGGE